MVMKAYENLTEEDLVFADHYFESGNFEALAKLQKVSAKRGNKPTDHINASTILNDHVVQDR